MSQTFIKLSDWQISQPLVNGMKLLPPNDTKLSDKLRIINICYTVTHIYNIRLIQHIWDRTIENEGAPGSKAFYN